MLVSHEVPFVMMGSSHSFNDYDYALVHLFPENKNYFSFFESSLAIGRETILDNSVFELGSPVEDSFFEEWVRRLKPTYFIAPDKFTDKDFTIQSAEKWSKFSKKNSQKMIGVIQGKTLEEMEECYKKIEPLCDKVAISFAQPLFSDLINTDKDTARLFGRFLLINHLIQRGVINKDKKHHLLGCALPQEVSFYKHQRYSFIDSIDTSSPVVHGFEGILFGEEGVSEKSETKLIDIINSPIQNEDLIYENIKIFKSFL